MDDLISRRWLVECVNEGWIKFDTEKDENRFIHLVRDIAPSAQPVTPCHLGSPCEYQNPDAKMPSAQPKWIPIKTKPMTEDDREYYSEVFDWHLSDEDAVMFDCPMPEDSQEVWVCRKDGVVASDICIIDEGIGLEGNWDWEDIVAWMPFIKPEPYKEGEKE